jgi:hypothetical protein
MAVTVMVPVPVVPGRVDVDADTHCRRPVVVTTVPVIRRRHGDTAGQTGRGEYGHDHAFHVLSSKVIVLHYL